MKPQLSIILSSSALAILVVVQAYNILITFETKKEQFDANYGMMVRQALYGFDSQFPINQSDSLMLYLDNYGEALIYQNPDAFSFGFADSTKAKIVSVYANILKSYRNPDSYLKAYLKNANADPEFRSGYYISELQLLNFEREIPIYKDTINSIPSGLQNALLVDAYTIEGNYFRIRYAYFVDFTHKTSIIYRDMIITLALAVVTILIVALVFTLTVRNMIKLKRLSDMKTDFINNMTHELKTPLSTIAVASSTLSNENAPKNHEKIKQISQLIHKQNKHLSELIDRILDVSIWEKDEVRLQKKALKIHEFMVEKVKLFEMENHTKPLKIHEEYHIQTETVHLDEIHFTTVINNLLSNAVKYCIENPCINLVVNSDENLTISISDNGIGISKEEQKHVFDKFYRVGKGDFKTVKGLGLGLYYVKRIVDAHEGNIALHSTPGKGSVFTITIPIRP